MAKKKLPTWATKVTPFSKALALFMLVAFPIFGFYFGVYYQKQMDQNIQPKTTIIYKTNPSACLPPDGTVICRSDSDCPSNYTCAQAGPIRVNQHQKTCCKKGNALPL